MASLRDIRKRIRSVKNTQKITKAMKLVAAARLRRAQEAITQARPYASEIGSLLQRVAARASAEGDGSVVHPLLDVRPPSRVLLVVITSDRGQCGAFNSNILRRAERFMSENRDRFDHLEVAAIGRKGRDYFRKKPVNKREIAPFATLTYRRASEIAEELVKEFIDHKLDAVYLLYNEFHSAISQRVTVQDVLPIVQEELPADEGGVDYIYEPNREEVLEELIPRYVATQVWRALLESAASEWGARMTAMDSATRNARELVEEYTLQYNRARQSAITRDLMDIVGGAEALKG